MKVAIIGAGNMGGKPLPAALPKAQLFRQVM